MEEVNVTKLRKDLAAYLDKVRRGQQIKVTSRGKVIACWRRPKTEPLLEVVPAEN